MVICFELIFALLTFADTRVRVLAGTFVNLVVCAKFPVGSKFHFSKWKTYFTQFIDKLLKFEEMEYLIIILRLKCGQPCVNFPSYFQR